MRLPLSKVWRAFPELDRFSDEQCQRFVRASRRGAGRAVRVVAVLATLFVSWLASAVFLGWLFLNPATIGRWERDHPFVLLGVLPAVILLATTPAILLRDRLLRRHVMRIITLRGRCLMCKYSLLGLPVGANLLVVCPECGATTPVDPALGELMSAEAGQARFQPRPEQFPEYRAFFTPERVRTITRWSLRVFVTVCILTGGALVYHELRIRADARQAAADRAGPDGIEAFVATLAKQAEGEKVNGWAVMMEAFAEADDIQATVRGRVAASDPDADADVSLIFAAERDAPQHLKERFNRNQALGLEVLEQARASGLFDRLDRVADVRHAVRPLDHDRARPAFLMTIPDHRYIRHLARLNAARLHTACAAGDAEAAGKAMATGLAMARMLGQQPLHMDKLTAQGIEALCFSIARKRIMQQPGEAMLAALLKAVESQAAGDDRRDWLAGERTFSLDTIRWLYADPSNVRWGWFSLQRPLARLLGGRPPFGRVPYYGTTLAQLDTMDAAGLAALAGPRQNLSSGSGETPARGNLLLDYLHFSRPARIRDMLDNQAFDRRALLVLIAVERFRALHHDPPPSLQALVPEFMPSVPIDPFCGLPLGYMLIDPATDQYGRCFLIFGAGHDGVQDLPSAPVRASAIARWPGAAAPGSHKDVVFNTPGD